MARSVKATVEGAGQVGVMLTPEAIAANGSEHAHQAALMQWVAIDGQRLYHDLDLLHAIPNGGDRLAHVGGKLKAEGVKSGVPDLCLPVPCGRYAGLRIEMKVPAKETAKDYGLSGSQIKWCTRLAAQYYAVLVCFDWESAKRAIRCYYESRQLNDTTGYLVVTRAVLEEWREKQWA